MKQIIQAFILALVCQFSLSAQYISTVTQPNKDQFEAAQAESESIYPALTDIKAEDMKKHLYTLASAAFEGRETGYPGNEKAGNYIADYLKSIGLPPAPGMKDHFQPIALTFTTWSEPKIEVGEKSFKHLWDFIAFPNGCNALQNISVNEVVFLGYGIKDKKYNDYCKAKVKGKTILINEGEPMMDDTKYRITKNDKPSPWSSDFSKKLAVAKAEGVNTILVISNDIKKLLGENRRKLLGPFVELSNTKGKSIDQPNVIYISSAIAKEIIGANESAIIEARTKIKEKGEYKPVNLATTTRLNLLKKQQLIEGRNVIAYIEGKQKKNEVVIVSAHYDHIGKKGEVIYFGADDNGSGTTTLLELAQTLAMAKAKGTQPNRSIMLLWMTGEEKGLLGSEYYAEHPIVPIKNTVADINIDMVGRMDKKYIDQKITDYTYVIGSDRLSSDLHKINESINDKHTQFIMDYTYNDANDPNQFYYRSDHYNFAKKGIPAIFFFTGVHEDYHQPGDVPEKIGYDKMEKLGRHIYRLLSEIANRPERLVVDGKVE